jgi:hypothetical protein
MGRRRVIVALAVASHLAACTHWATKCQDAEGR